MRILVTGGAGYVGSFATRHLIGAGHHVVVIDNFCQGHRGPLPDDIVVEGDIADRELLGRLMREHEVEAVMHFAAATNVKESVELPEYHWRNNTVNTLGLLETMLENDVRKIVFSSTAATYGSTGETPLVEDAPKNPVCPYGYSKLAIEWMIQDMSHAHGLGYMILRYFNAAGAAADGSHGEAHVPETHLIPLIIEAVQGKREVIEIFGEDWDTADGTCLRDYVHVEDLAQAHELAVTRCPEPGSTPGGHIMNVGTGSGNTVMEVVKAVEKVTGKKVPYRMTGRRPGDPAKLVASSERLRKVLGWKPQFTEIEQVVETAWKWHESHPDGYDS
ncbi:MAG: UDP-glucose 4-epimerase GalE [Deltaproteobacteria bacterium]|nr:UDP-glucose 4-epimerase GalE [Deltaproteobacteria bacterium]